MRDFINQILDFIGAPSLNDDEFDMITIEDEVLSKELYTEVLLVLDSRETVSNIRDRLGLYFRAAGVDIGTPPSAGSTKIYMGDDLCS